jgi:hypothetical protein
MGRRGGRKSEAFLYSLLGIAAVIIAIGQFLFKHIWVVISVVFIPLVIFLTVQLVKHFFLPKIEISAEIQQEVQKLINFVYSGGKPPSEKILSKKSQHHILCQIFAMEIDVEKYKPFIQEIYQNAINNGYTYSRRAYGDEWYPSLHFAFEELVKNIIELTVRNTSTRKCFKDIDNLAGRLLKMDKEVFKNLFLRLHEYHFWYVYNRDNDYSIMLDSIKRKLESYHGIKQTGFYKKISGSKDEISYTLYFGEKAGEIIRKKDGRTYRLYLPQDNPDEIPPYEYTHAAVDDGDFNYKDYWKDIEKALKKNEGILQTEFYKLFNWSSEILTRALREAEKDGKVLREKKGNTYILYMPKQ